MPDVDDPTTNVDLEEVAKFEGNSFKSYGTFSYSFFVVVVVVVVVAVVVVVVVVVVIVVVVVVVIKMLLCLPELFGNRHQTCQKHQNSPTFLL